MKTSLGIWAFGSMVTPFVPGGYQPERAAEPTAARVGRVTTLLVGLDVGTTGAALLGGVPCGTFADAHEAVAAPLRVSERIEPDPDLRAFYADRYRVYRTLYRTLKEIR
jgi:hypothetical protein